MQIGEENLAGAQHGALFCQWFLDLDDHVCCAKDGFGIINDFCAHLGVGPVIGANAVAGVGFNAHAMSGSDQLGCAFGGETHPIFMVFDFFWYTNVHDSLRG